MIRSCAATGPVPTPKLPVSAPRTRSRWRSGPRRQPSPASLTCVLIETHDVWLVSDRRYLSEAPMDQLTPPAPTSITATQQQEVIDNAAIRAA